MSEIAIAYRRVSTTGQGDSGAGLDAQQHDITKFCQAHHIELIGDYSEVASAKGKTNRRPILTQAIGECKRNSKNGTKCYLIVSKLDRLSRNMKAVVDLIEDAKVNFVVVQFGLRADNFQLQLFASLGEKEPALSRCLFLVF
jgi:DNA invertase Pin-like site-specific DNA recombinase